jgi:hypothetical protein
MTAISQSSDEEEVLALLGEPLPADLRATWTARLPDKSFASRVVARSLAESQVRSQTARTRIRRIALGLALGGVSTAAALVQQSQAKLGPDVVPPATMRPVLREPSTAASPLLGFAFAEREQGKTPRSLTKKTKIQPKTQPQQQAHYPLCGCSTGAIVCSCVEP